MKTFIRVTEIWVPKDGVLVFHDGLYGELSAFKAVSQATTFKPNEGLPGKAWALRHPIVLKDLVSSYFQRGEAAVAAGLTCAIALPIFAADALKAVIVFMCGSDEEHVGAIEAWSNDPEESSDIGLVDGYYGSAELFEWTSRNVRFGRGFGLPGAVWQAGMPLIAKDLFRPGQFLRWKEAQQVGLSAGIGVPCLSDAPRDWVMTFLSALGTPIARRFEIWTPAGAGALAFQVGSCEHDPDLATAYANTRIGPGEGPLGEVAKSGVPCVGSTSSTPPGWFRKSLEGAALTEFMAMPVLGPDGQTRAIVAWYF